MGSASSPDGEFPRAWVAGACAVAAGIRLAQLLRPLAQIDRVFVSDDAYYTLTIARSIAHGLGPTTDGSHLTSGFQPLLAFSLVPFHWIGLGADACLRVDLLLLIGCDVLSVWLLGVVSWRLCNRVTAIVASTAWAIAPVATRAALGGLEASMAVACELAVLVAWIWANDQPGSRSRSAGVGLVAGLAVLARFDALILVALLVVAQAAWGARRVVPYLVATMSAVVLPWWLWCLAQFGSVVPTSAAAERRIAHTPTLSRASMSLAAATVVRTPLALGDGLREWFLTHASVGVAVFAVLVASGLLLSLDLAVNGRGRERREQAPIRHVPTDVVGAVAVLFGTALLALYAWFAVGWNLDRYLLPVMVISTVIGARIATAFLVRGPRMVAAALLAGALASAAGAGQAHLWALSTVPSRSYQVASGYREAALELLAHLPDRARVGAWQSGAVSYYASRGIVVENLDGVVNPQAPNPNDAAATLRYLGAEHVDWLVDWRVMIVRAESAAASTPGARPFAVVAVFNYPGQQVAWVVRLAAPRAR